MGECKIFESGVIEEITGEGIRPGGMKLTGEAMDFCKFPANGKILDIGCGNGATLEYIENRYGLEGTGVDPSLKLIEEGKSRNERLNLSLGFGEFLSFPSHTFDGALMECVLSIIERQTEALHEAFCVLKPGGKLIISDLFIKDPDPQAVLAAQREAIIARNKPHEEGACESEERKLPPELCLNGVIVMESLLEALEDTGFKVLLWDDKSDELKSFAGQVIFELGSMEAFWQRILPADSDCAYLSDAMKKSKLGYFLLIAEKVG